jgi:hypothetical protein
MNEEKEYPNKLLDFMRLYNSEYKMKGRNVMLEQLVYITAKALHSYADAWEEESEWMDAKIEELEAKIKELESDDE